MSTIVLRLDQGKKISFSMEKSTKLINAFGAELVRRRKIAKLSQEKLGLKVGVERVYISRIERGISQPSLTVIVRLGKALGIKASEMLACIEDVEEN